MKTKNDFRGKIKTQFQLTVFAVVLFLSVCVQNVWGEIQDERDSSYSSGYSLSYVFSQLDMNNTELRRLREEYAQSILDVKDAKAGYGPSIDLLVTGTYMTDPMIGKIALNLQDIISAINY